MSMIDLLDATDVIPRIYFGTNKMRKKAKGFSSSFIPSNRRFVLFAGPNAMMKKDLVLSCRQLGGKPKGCIGKTLGKRIRFKRVEKRTIRTEEVISILSDAARRLGKQNEMLARASRYAATFNQSYDWLSSRQPRRILDFGSGGGWASILAKTFFPENHIVAVDGCMDEASKMLLLSEGIDVGEKYFFQNGSKIPYDEGSFDVCLFLEVLEHCVENPRHIMGELFRILEDNGLLVITTPNIAGIYKRFRLLVGKQPQAFLTDPGGIILGDYGGHIREWTLGELVSLLESAGFSILDKAFIECISARGSVRSRMDLRFAYYPYRAAVGIWPGLRSNICIVAQKRKGS